MALTAIQVKNAKAIDKPLKLSDGGGLFLFVQPNGSKYWRLAYRFQGKQKTLALGVYDAVGLSDARERRDAAKKLLANDTDPGLLKQVHKRSKKVAAENSFEAVAREWFTKFSSQWVASHSERIIRRLERDVFPWIGQRPIAELTAQELLMSIRRIENRGALETAHRALQNCGQILRYGIATGRAERDLAADLKGALPPTKEKHHSSIIDPVAIGGLLRAINDYQGSFITKCALQLAPYTFVRPGELRHAEWSEIDLEAQEWRIPASKMKMRSGHIVPLSKQAMSVLLELQNLTGEGRYLFPGLRTSERPMSENTVNGALRRLGYTNDEITGHGFRAMARTILDETLGFSPDWIEHQLAHAVRDPNGRAYNRTSHLPQRREMMQAWANYLDGLATGAKVISIKLA